MFELHASRTCSDCHLSLAYHYLSTEEETVFSIVFQVNAKTLFCIRSELKDAMEFKNNSGF